MIGDSLLQRVQRLWVGLAGTPVVFRDAAVEVVVSPHALLCPPGWVGIVALEDAVIATAPDRDVAETVRRALNDLPTAAMTDPVRVRGMLPVDKTLGPATLAYCDAASFRPADSTTVEMIPADHADLETLLARVPADDADESGLAEITSPAFVVRTATEVTAAAGYRLWPGNTAQISVLAAPAERGRGLARVVATAAITNALQSDLLPQWRARPEASRRVARALGFHELGSQLSIRLTPVDGHGEPS
ncbi:GNAT family N-acetyltransferase [Plantactinospora sp. KLBMP9567]|uniref:GNAT family N-acetyltransferase n=1 Tax=Plantactinospora sp. KLBMP9567 TaxID=3085900 RepID=UPI00298179D3|nr:GNAT family N-acetyltransferase [Plantactinospora sp. KLBMP9567]MDW5328032.1 GNAT family N-acetyltransferase [Plantactinospora sp. KLBMP9567]